jgi:signal transduction histidine kinase
MSRLPPILEIATRAKGRVGWWPALSVMSLLGLGALTILLLIFHTSQSQDELAQQSERALARTLMAQQGGHLAKLAFDYSFWTEAYENVTVAPNPEWMTYQTDYLRDTWHAGFVAFIDSNNRTIHISSEPGLSVTGAEQLRGDDFYRIVSTTRRAPIDAAEAQSGLAWLGTRIYLVTASAVTPETTDAWPINGNPQTRDVLLIGLPLTPERLAEICEPYGLRLPMVTGSPAGSDRESIPLTSKNGQLMGYLSWRASNPGAEIARRVLPAVAGAFIIMAILAFLILRHQERLRRAHEARLMELRESHERLNAQTAFRASVIGAIGDGIAVFDRTLRLVEWNRRYLEIFTYPPGHLRAGISLEELLRFDSRHGIFGGELTERAIAELLAKARLIDPTPQEFQTRSGQILELTRSPVPDGGHVVSIRDITAYRRAEHQAMAARDQAEVANRAKSEFLANMSHELRTPLNAILGFSEVMMSEMFGPLGHGHYRQYAGDIHESGQHLLSLINDILDLSKIEAGRLSLMEEEVDPVEIAKAVLRLVAGRAENAGLQVEFSADGDIARYRLDPRAMKQVLLNLISNAIKFTPAGGQIAVRLSVTTAYELAYQISDTGIGIAAGDIQRVMAPFGQVDSHLSRKHPGTGLGLPISHALTMMHGGALRLDSQPGVGTIVTVILPPLRRVSGSGGSITAAA